MHNILYRSFPEKTSQEKIIRECLAIVRNNGSRWGTDHIRFFDGVVCDNAAAAKEYITVRDNGFYGGLAVRYYEFGNVPDSKHVAELKEKFAAVDKARHEFYAEHLPSSSKAEYVGCRGCGSRINRQYLHSKVACPVCHADLRSRSVQDRLNKYLDQLRDLEEKIGAEQLKSKKKASICWLVKFEYNS